jgi:hypothetical protein
MNKYTIMVRQIVTHAIPVDAESSEEAKQKVNELFKRSWITDLPEPVSSKYVDDIEDWHIIYN